MNNPPSPSWLNRRLTGFTADPDSDQLTDQHDPPHRDPDEWFPLDGWEDPDGLPPGGRVLVELDDELEP